VTPAYDHLLDTLKRLPGLGYRSAERVAMHLLAERPTALRELTEALTAAGASVGRCEVCGNLAEGERCAVCEDSRRDNSAVCVVEQVPDLFAIERSGAWPGVYHVLHGKLSPIHGVGPEDLNFKALERRIEEGVIGEFVLALSNDKIGRAHV